MLGSHVHEELVEVSITYPGCKEQWRSAEEREVVSFDWVSDGLCLVDKSLMDIGPCCSCPSLILDLPYSIDYCWVCQVSAV